MENRQGQGEQDGEQQGQENLVFSFPGYKTPTQLPIPPLPILQSGNFTATSHFQQPVVSVPYPIGQQYLHTNNSHLLHNANLAARTTPPTLGQIASRIKEKASAAKRSQQQDDMDVDGPEDENEGDEDGDGDDNDGEGGGGGGDQTTGRWTKAEHELFLAALKKFGKVSTLPQ